MHANSEQLLAFDSGDLADPVVRDHIESCADCRNRVAGFAAIVDQLRELPEMAAPDDAWQKIVSRAHTADNNKPANVMWRVSATAMAASLVVVLALHTMKSEPELGSLQALEQQPSELETLVNQSKVLESYLSQVQHGRAVTTAQTASTIVELEDSIAYIDYRLNNSRELGITESERVTLWRYRNELMQSLVTVHYAQAKAKSI